MGEMFADDRRSAPQLVRRQCERSLPKKLVTANSSSTTKTPPKKTITKGKRRRQGSCSPVPPTVVHQASAPFLTPREEAVMEEQHKQLVDDVKDWGMCTVTFFPLLASFLIWLRGESSEQWGGPLLSAGVGIVVRVVAIYFTSIRNARRLQTLAMIVFLSLAVLRHCILYDGCSACVTQAVFGVVPCFAAFLFRTTTAIHYSAAYVMLLLTILYGIDFTGNCPSEPSGLGSSIITNRLIPMIMMIVGTTTILSGIVRTLQDSLLVQAKAAIEAEKLAAMRRDVLHRVTHELRTPLNGMLGSVELLATSESVSEGDMEHVLIMKRCLSSILGICDDVLTIAKADQVDTNSEALHRATSAGGFSATNPDDPEERDRRKAASKSKPFILASVVDDVVDMFGASIANKGVELQVDFRSHTAATYFGEEIKLRQVLLNLVGNALKFTNEGRITIRVQEDTSPSRSYEDTEADLISESSCEDTPCWFKFEVEDTGIGIDPKEASLLFEPFHQGEQNQGGVVSRSFQGTGLGLSICREFVGQMDGEIWADGTPGVGSCFAFTACLDRMEETQQPTLEKSTSRSRVLLIGCTEEVRQSCLSIVRSVAPAIDTTVEEVTSQEANQRFLEVEEPVDFSSDRTDTKNQTQQIAFVLYYHTSDPNDSMDSLLMKLKRRDWKLIMFADQKSYSDLRTKWADDAYAVFRRPVSLGIVGETFQAALMSKKAPQRHSTDNLLTPRGRARKKKTFSPWKDRLAALSKETAPMPPLLPPPPAPPPPAPPCDGDYQEMRKKVTVSPLLLARKKMPDKVALGTNTKIMVVDDTALNVKVLVTMISRLTSATIMTCSDGQEAVEMVMSASPSDELLIFMDWHMPGVCGLTATSKIRKYVDGSGVAASPSAQVCMLTADIEGLYGEMETKGISYDGAITKGKYVRSRRRDCISQESLSVEIVAGKPITFQTIKAIFQGFQSAM